MKLLLTSAGFYNPKIGKKFLELVGKPAKEIKVIFVPTASITKEELHWVGLSKKELEKLGVGEIKVFDLDHNVNWDEIKDYDAIYVCGGNTFHLLKKVKESGFDKIIKQFLRKGGLYVGVSAGSILMGPNIEISRMEGLGDKNTCGIKNFTGLKLVDMAISPHANRRELKIIEKFQKKVDYKVLPLTDSQALLILGNKKKIIE